MSNFYKVYNSILRESYGYEAAEDFGDREGGDYKDPFTKLRDDIEDYIDDLSSGMYDGDRSAAHTIAVELEDILQRNKADEAEEY